MGEFYALLSSMSYVTCMVDGYMLPCVNVLQERYYSGEDVITYSKGFIRKPEVVQCNTYNIYYGFCMHDIQQYTRI